MTFIKNIEDTRESASIKIIKKLNNKLNLIDISEPYLKSNNNLLSENHKFLKKYKINNIHLSKSKIKKYDVVMILSDHDKFNYNLIKKESKILIDTRNRVFREIGSINYNLCQKNVELFKSFLDFYFLRPENALMLTLRSISYKIL